MEGAAQHAQATPPKTNENKHQPHTNTHYHNNATPTPKPNQKTPKRLYNVPWAINRMVSYMDQRYGRPEIWVLENGISEKGEASRSGAAALQDPLRTRYFQG